MALHLQRWGAAQNLSQTARHGISQVQAPWRLPCCNCAPTLVVVVQGAVAGLEEVADCRERLET